MDAGTIDRHIAPGDVLVVDEASQLADGALERILDASLRHDVRLLLLGDPRQQTALERGALVGELARRGARERWPECVELTVAHRFRDAAMAAVLSAFRAGDAHPLTQHLTTRGAIVETATADDSVGRITEAWLRNRTALVVTTGSNLRRDQLGSAIVAALLRNGEVSAQSVEVQADVDNPRRVSLHVGQRVRLQRQVMAEDLVTRLAANGETALLEAVVEGKRGADPEVHLRFDDGRVLQMRSDALVATHAYVLQSLKAQGATADSVLLDWQDVRVVERAYPALSRQRESLTVYMAPQAEAFDDGPPSAPADRLALAARRDGGLQAAIAQVPAADTSPELRALSAAPPLATTVGQPRQNSDGDRVSAAVHGEVDAATFTAAELTAALQRLTTDSLLAQRRREAVLLRGGPVLPRSLAAPARRAALQAQPVRGPTPRREPLAPRWQPSPAQRPRLEEARRAWPQEERLETRVLLAALRREPQRTPQRAGELVDTFHSSLDQRWQRHASAFGVTGAPRPSTGPDAQRACSVALGRVGPTIAIPTPDLSRHPVPRVRVPEVFAPYHHESAVGLRARGPSRGIHL